jgi:hypothetical protein
VAEALVYVKECQAHQVLEAQAEVELVHLILALSVQDKTEQRILVAEAEALVEEQVVRDLWLSDISFNN